MQCKIYISVSCSLLTGGRQPPQHGLYTCLYLPCNRSQGLLLAAESQDIVPGRQPVEIVPLVELLVHLFAEGQEVLCPPDVGAEIGILRIKLKPDAVCQTIEHCVHHIVHLYKEPAIHSNAIHHPSAK